MSAVCVVCDRSSRATRDPRATPAPGSRVFTGISRAPRASRARASRQEAISPISIVGFVIFFAGLFGYSYLTYKSRNRGTTKPAEPVAATGAKETTKLVSS